MAEVFFMFALFCVLAIVAAVARVMWVICVVQPAANKPHAQGPMRVCVVLGSGGHTSEMLRTLSALPSSYWENNRPFYVVGATDQHSAQLASVFERSHYRRKAAVFFIPRAREVGQSYVTSVFSTLKAIGHTFRIVYAQQPDVLLTNGPGVCVPVVVCSVLLASFCPWRVRRAHTVYFESFTCVHHISLTGRLLAPFLADVFTTNWNSLTEKVRPWRCRGTLCAVGFETILDTEASSSLPSSPAGSGSEDRAAATSTSSSDAYAVVTVGSTRFDALIQAVTTPDMCRTLRSRLGITRLLVQYGTTPFDSLRIGHGNSGNSDMGSDGIHRLLCEGVTIEAFSYRPNLGEAMRHASLVLTHAGAGTLLECLYAHRLTVVVPNAALMAGHQLELADALAVRKFLFCVTPEKLQDAMKTLDFDDRKIFPGLNRDALLEVLSRPLRGCDKKERKE